MLAGLFLLAQGGSDAAPPDEGGEATVATPDRPPARGGPGGRRDAAAAAGEVELASSSAASQREREIRLWERRLARAQLTLDGYRESTRYPHESRPIREHPDQVYPASPEREQLLDKEDPAGNVRLRLKQEHVFLAGDQTVDFWVRCEDPQGAAVPCEVTSAVVHEVEHVEGARQLVAVP
ncbi:MAG: hypothetical protein L0Y66_00340, partial [Myxococcaceae bacterium]|nr:hypothetical protein [Myxococcaceae bacterium]